MAKRSVAKVLTADTRPVTANQVNRWLAKQGYAERLARAAPLHFYFYGGNASADEYVAIEKKVGELTLAEWEARLVALRKQRGAA